MTTGIATICGNATAIIIVADKMLGFGHVESAVGDKILTLHDNWRVLYAGNDISPALPIVERAAIGVKDNSNPTVLEIATAMTSAWKAERDGRTEAKLLSGRVGWTLQRFFDEGKDHFLTAEVTRLTDAIEDEELDLELMIVGFDDRNRPFILSMDGHGRGIPEQRPGFWAIGSGALNSLTFLSWREVKPAIPIRGAIAFAIEAKYYSELASGVSEETDVRVMRANVSDIIVNKDDIEDVLFQKIAIANRPREIAPRQLDMLNRLKDLEGIPYVWGDKKKNLIETDKRPRLTRPKRGDKSSTAVEVTQSAPQSQKSPKDGR